MICQIEVNLLWRSTHRRDYDSRTEGLHHGWFFRNRRTIPKAVGRTSGAPLGTRWAALRGILAVARAYVCWDLDRTSLWYDEVVTMRVARADESPRIDRPARPDRRHPRTVASADYYKPGSGSSGSSDLAGRAFSAVCGLATVWVISVIGRWAYDHATGLWSAWLAAVCPPLVYYSHEARMYAWLVLLTSLSWLVFLSFRQRPRRTQCLTMRPAPDRAGYSHPARAVHGRGARPGLPSGATGPRVDSPAVADDPASA